MTKISSFFILLFYGLLSVLGPGCESKKGGDLDDVGLSIGEQIPEFEQRDTDGRDIDFEAAKGKVLIFSTNQCDYCSSFFQKIRGFRQPANGRQVMILHRSSGVNENDSLRRAMNWEVPVLTADHKTFRKFKIRYTPFAYKISGEGKVEAKTTLGDADKFREFITD